MVTTVVLFYAQIWFALVLQREHALFEHWTPDLNSYPLPSLTPSPLLIRSNINEDKPPKNHSETSEKVTLTRRKRHNCFSFSLIRLIHYSLPGDVIKTLRL